MKQTKFRVQRDADNKWLYFTIEQLHAGDSNGVIVADHTWCLSTGRKGKNGVEIYEGDIVMNPDGMIYVVKYSAGYGFTPIQQPVDYDEIYAGDDHWEVIGNIHDNPEL